MMKFEFHHCCCIAFGARSALARRSKRAGKFKSSQSTKIFANLENGLYFLMLKGPSSALSLPAICHRVEPHSHLPYLLGSAQLF